MIKLGNPKRLVMASTTLGCALGIGYFMQAAAHQPAPAPGVSEAAIEADAFATAFVGAVPAPQRSDNTVTAAEDLVSDDDKISGTTLDTAKAGADALGTDPDKEQLFEDAARDAENDAEDATNQATPVEDLNFAEVQLTSAEPVPPIAAPQPQALPDTPLELAALQDTPIRDMPKEEPSPALSCEIEMTARVEAAAMVAIELNAPCLTDTQFTLHHSGMMFSALTDSAGAWSMQVPALSETSVFIAAFDNGEGAVANAEVDTLALYDRYVVQWKGQSGLQLHAMEYGATYGEDGHVWHDAARGFGSAATGEGGFLMRLGEGVIEDTVLVAEVYTFPTQTARREGNISVSVEAEVHAANCGRDIEAQTLTKSGGDDITAQDLTLAVPECDAVGDFLVLNNLYEDLKIARN